MNERERVVVLICVLFILPGIVGYAAYQAGKRNTERWYERQIKVSSVSFDEVFKAYVEQGERGMAALQNEHEVTMWVTDCKRVSQKVWDANKCSERRKKSLQENLLVYDNTFRETQHWEPKP